MSSKKLKIGEIVKTSTTYLCYHSSMHFFIGSGKLRIWYIIFYIFGFPLYLFGVFLFSQLQPGQGPQGGEFILSILAIGYLLLGFFSMINTILYIQAAKKLIRGSVIFLGFQIVFWGIGYALGNHYLLLFFFFSIAMCLALYLNLCALWHVQHKTHLPHKTAAH